MLSESIVWNSPSGDTEADILYLAATHYDLEFLSKDTILHTHSHKNANASQYMTAYFNKWGEATEMPRKGIL